MSESKCCACSAAPKLIFPCSGAADVGALSDQAAREMTKRGIGKMFCLAGIGGGVSGIIETTKSVDKILVIDGCPLECASKTLINAGIETFEHMKLHDLGYKKGKTEINQEAIDSLVVHASNLLSCK